MKTMMKVLAFVLALAMLTCCLAACGSDDKSDKGNNDNKPDATTAPNTNDPDPTDPEPTDPEPTDPVDDGKKEYKIVVTDSEGNPVSGVLVQICKEGSTCFTPTRTDEDGVAVWKLVDAADYYGTVSSTEEGMPKEYFGDAYVVTLVYNPSVG